MGGGRLRAGDGDVRCSGLFFSRCPGVIWGVVLSGRGVRRRSGLFRFVRICSGLFGGDSAWMVVPGVRGCLVDREVGIGSHFRSSRVW